jgi:hypothetical protein
MNQNQLIIKAGLHLELNQEHNREPQVESHLELKDQASWDFKKKRKAIHHVEDLIQEGEEADLRLNVETSLHFKSSRD